MRITTKNGYRSKCFNYSTEDSSKIGLIAMQITKMGPCTNPLNMEKSYDGEGFAEGCLDLINQLYPAEVEITKTNMNDPTWAKFKDSCSRYWHMEKSKNLELRGYRHSDKGHLRIKMTSETPLIIRDKVEIASQDKIMARVVMEERRSKYDAQITGRPSKNFIGKIREYLTYNKDNNEE